MKYEQKAHLQDSNKARMYEDKKKKDKLKQILAICENNINDKEIADWVNECPTHKIEVLYSDENGIQLLVNFNNEKGIQL